MATSEAAGPVSAEASAAFPASVGVTLPEVLSLQAALHAAKIPRIAQFNDATRTSTPMNFDVCICPISVL